MRHLSDTTRRHSLVEVMSSRRLSIGVESSSFHAAPHMGDTFAPIGEVIESAFGDGFTGIMVALVIAYLVAGVLVFNLPNPLRYFAPGASARRAKERARKTAVANGETPEEETFPDPMPPGDLTNEELRRYDGSNPALPILLAAKGRIFDMTRGRDFYGKGGPYNCFAGIDCSRALAKVSLEKKDLNANCADLFASERDVLNDWVAKFEAKYPVVGNVLDSTYDGAP